MSSRGAGWEALCACTRVFLGTAGRSELEVALSAQVDWGKLLPLAGRHRLVQALWPTLAGVDHQLAPPEAVALMRAARREQDVQTLRLASFLPPLVERLTAHGLRVLPIKGPTAAVQLYGDETMRPSADLDLLLPWDDVAAARRVLEEAGYALDPGYELVDDVRFWRHAYEMPLVGRNGACVELHWGIVKRALCPDLDPGYFWTGLRPVEVIGRTVSGMAPEPLLMLLSAHASRHFWDRLGYVADVAQLVRTNPGLGWRSLFERANAFGTGRMVRLGLALARDLLGVELPAPAADSLRSEPWLRRAEATVVNLSLVRPPESMEPHQGFLLGLQERRRLRWLLLNALTPGLADRAAVRLPGALFPLYRVIRPIRLGWLFGRTSLSRLRGGG